MPFSIEEFKSQLGNGLARVSHFNVRIWPAAILDADVQLLTYRAMDVNLAGRQLATVENHIYGPLRTFAHNQTFTPCQITFLCSHDWAEKKLLERWQDLAIGQARGQNGVKTGSFDVGYYDDYVGQIDILTYDENGFETTTTSLIEAYPITVGDVQMSWTDDNIAVVTASFVYRYYINDEYPSSDAANSGDTTA